MTDRPKRKAIPDAVKLRAVLRVEGRCRQCGERLGDLSGLQFDHRPALVNDRSATTAPTTCPLSLTPSTSKPLHLKCHDTRTNGPGGEKASPPLAATSTSPRRRSGWRNGVRRRARWKILPRRRSRAARVRQASRLRRGRDVPVRR